VTDIKRQTKYVIITPARDEEKYIVNTLDSVVSQTIRPEEWVIVNDGSSDGTGAIIEDYASRHTWLNVIHREDRGCRTGGYGVMDAFYDGYNALKAKNWDFLVKLDGDLGFDPPYFERCFSHFQEDPGLGIGGGFLIHPPDQELRLEENPSFHVRGATKIYRRQCWTAIGGLVKAPGWDTIDEVKANMLGWSTRTFRDLELIHYRPTGLAYGHWTDSVKGGRAAFISGYHPVFMLIKCLRRIFQEPFFVNGTGLMYGFVRSYFDGTQQINDPALIAYIRKQQVKKLLFMKSIWK
jgi:glycosyltransferase involved in cell wall biosynthesis